jgi:hypothetical protein
MEGLKERFAEVVYSQRLQARAGKPEKTTSELSELRRLGLSG